jgi:hypothetical protein
MTTPARGDASFHQVRVPRFLAGLRLIVVAYIPTSASASVDITTLLPPSFGTSSLIQIEVPEVPIRAI